MDKKELSKKFYAIDCDERCIDLCDYADCYIGSRECSLCPMHRSRNVNKQFVRCIKYGDEDINYYKIQRP